MFTFFRLFRFDFFSLALLVTMFSLMLVACDTDLKKKSNVSNSVIEPSMDYAPNWSELSRIEKESLQFKVDSVLSGIIDTNRFSGGILVAKRGEILYEKYAGYSSVKLQFPVRAKTPLHLASVSKVLTATAILRLIQQGKMKLDDSVKKYLPEFPYPEISVRMLLSHRSGLPKYEYFTFSDTVWGYSKILRNQDLLDLLVKFKFPLYAAAGSKFAYCNTNYAILALVMENVTKKIYAEAMDDLVFSPLKMNRTSVANYPKDRYKLSQSYDHSFRKLPFMYLDAIYGDKNVYSTARDLLKYDLAMYNDDFLSAELKKEMYQGYSYERKGVNNYGLGIRIKEWTDGTNLLYHHGWWHGNTATYVTLKSDSVTIIALSNNLNRKIYKLSSLSSLFNGFVSSGEEEGN